jgi:tRNA pseudouridine55 synthase
VAATGLLPLCFGEATKVGAFLLESDKTYVADLALGVTTSTGDREGEVLKRRTAPELSVAEIREALDRFVGESTQVPPMYSALKRDGRPLYAYARAGIEVERSPRPVTIHSLRLLEHGAEYLRLEVHCSKGTYIRTLAEDLGEVFGCGAHLAALRRTAAGPFRLEDAHPIARFDGAGRDFDALDALLLPIDSALGAFPAVTLADAAELRAVTRGQGVRPELVPEAGPCRIYAPGGRFLGMGEIDACGGLAPRRMMHGAEVGKDDRSR